jgi:hypothetical protein
MSFTIHHSQRPLQPVPSQTNEIAGRLEEVLTEAAALGVSPNPSSRFPTYVRTLEQVRASSGPGRFEFPADPLLYWEAVVQALQLRAASLVWPLLPRDILARKLRIVFTGSQLAPTSGKSDPARDALLELVTAALLYQQGFDVSLTDAADVEATFPGCPRLSVECKRPSNYDSALDRCIRDVREQLSRRYVADNVHGMAVLGFDRLLPTHRRALGTLNDKTFADFVRDETEQALQSIAQIADRPMRTFDGRTPLGAVVLAGAVMIDDGRALTTILRLQAFNLGDNEEMVARLLPLFNEPAVRQPRML